MVSHGSHRLPVSSSSRKLPRLAINYPHHQVLCPMSLYCTTKCCVRCPCIARSPRPQHRWKREFWRIPLPRNDPPFASITAGCGRNLGRRQLTPPQHAYSSVAKPSPFSASSRPRLALSLTQQTKSPIQELASACANSIHKRRKPPESYWGPLCIDTFRARFAVALPASSNSRKLPRLAINYPHHQVLCPLCPHFCAHLVFSFQVLITISSLAATDDANCSMTQVTMSGSHRDCETKSSAAAGLSWLTA